MKKFKIEAVTYDFAELKDSTKDEIIASILEKDEDDWVLADAYAKAANELVAEYKDNISLAIQTNGLISYAYEGFFNQGAGGSFTIDSPFYLKFTYDEENQLFVFGNSQTFSWNEDLAVCGSVAYNFSGYIKKVLEDQNFSTDNILRFLNEASFELYRCNSHYVHEKTISCTPNGNGNAPLDQYLGVEAPTDQLHKVSDYGNKLLEEVAKQLEEIFQNLSLDLFAELEEAYNFVYSTDFIKKLFAEEEGWKFFCSDPFCSDPEQFLGFTEDGYEVVLTSGYTIESVTVM